MSLRERAGVTQRQIANALDVTVGTVSNWERRVKEPHLDLGELQQLLKLYKCSVPEMVEAFGPIRVKIGLRDFGMILDLCEMTVDDLLIYLSADSLEDY